MDSKNFPVQIQTLSNNSLNKVNLPLVGYFNSILTSHCG